MKRVKGTMLSQFMGSQCSSQTDMLAKIFIAYRPRRKKSRWFLKTNFIVLLLIFVDVFFIVITVINLNPHRNGEMFDIKKTSYLNVNVILHGLEENKGSASILNLLVNLLISNHFAYCFQLSGITWCRFD